MGPTTIETPRRIRAIVRLRSSDVHALACDRDRRVSPANGRTTRPGVAA